MIQASLLQYFSKKSDPCTGQSRLFSATSNSDSRANTNSSETLRKKSKKSLSLRRKKTSKACNKSKSQNRCSAIKQAKDLKSSTCTAKVKTVSNPLPATPDSQDVIQVEDVTKGKNVKRNLFGTLPMEDDELTVNENAPLPSVNFSFCSPVKNSEGTIPDAISIHDSVSSSLDQLPPLGDGDMAMIIDDDHNRDNDSLTEHAYSEDDQWLENVSNSAWEGQLDRPDQDLGGVNARVLRRFVIQSVVIRQRIDPQSDESQSITGIPRSSREIVLELKPESSSPTHSRKVDSISTCLLRDDWLNSELSPGYKIQLVGCCDNSSIQCQTHIIDNRPGRFIIVIPDLLVSATTMATATGCMRRAVLAELFKGTGGHEVMLLGSLLHQVFEQVLVNFHGNNGDITDMRDCVIQLVHDTMNTFPAIMSMYGVGVSQDHVTEKLLEYVPMLLDWIKQFMNHTPIPGKGEIEFRRTPNCQEDNQWITNCHVGVSGVHDIEECIWSPRFGLKGKIDATVEVKMHTIRRPHNPQSGITQQESLEQFIVPLELKTGKMSHPLGSVDHRAQVMLYTLMLSEHYEGETPGGLLYYLKAGHMVGVPAFDHEIRALVMMRNRLASYLDNCYTNKLPEMLRYAHTCQYCPLLQSCCMFHKCVEDGTGESSGLKELFEQNVQHVTDGYKKFFRHWYHLACLEVWHSRRDSKEALWAQDTRHRMEQGLCIDQLTAGQISKQPDGSIIQTFQCDVRSVLTIYFMAVCRTMSKGFCFTLSSVPVWGGESRFVVSERVIISRQDGRGWGVATGYIKSLHNTGIDIVINKSLAANNSILYRLDISQSHIAIGNVMLSNLMSLMTCGKERGHRLRQLIIDGVEPVFGDTYYYDNSLVRNLNSGQKEAIQKVMSSKDYTIILGMPGTGKTLTIATLVRVLVSNGNSVLLASYTNTAIDNILLKLVQMDLDFLRLGSVHKVHPNLIGYTTAALATKVSNLEDLSNILNSKSVVATTCLGTHHEVFEQRVFDYCIIDEASQVTLPVCLGAIQYASQCFVLVGDHHQLPPLVESEEARSKGLNVSLFQLLSAQHPSSVVSLWQQFRMNKDIMLLSNTLVYNHKMECGSDSVAMATLNLSKWASIRNTLPNWLSHTMDPTHPVVFVNTDKVSGDKGETKGSHDQIYNELEANMVAKLVTTLTSCGCECDDIGVITPYRQQQYLIRSRLCSSDVRVSPVKLPVNKHTECSGVEVFTVDRYQGRDKPCIVVSFVRNNTSANVGGLLPDMHRINVALTRGRHKLIMIGSHDTLTHAPPLAKLFTVLTTHDMILNLTKHIHL